MGRLTKAKIDRIVSLRKEGYTQKETAEQVGVNVRTVRKYDTTSRASTRKSTDLKARVTALEAIARILLEWLTVTWLTTDSEEQRCVKCGAQDMDFRNEGFTCGKCGHRMILPTEMCPNCLAIDRVDSEGGGKWVCQECGHRWQIV